MQDHINMNLVDASRPDALDRIVGYEISLFSGKNTKRLKCRKSSVWQPG